MTKRKPLKLILGLISKIPCWLGGSKHKWRRLRKAEIIAPPANHQAGEFMIAPEQHRICSHCGSRRKVNQRKAKVTT